jgi:hypothetical protein
MPNFRPRTRLLVSGAGASFLALLAGPLVHADTGGL